MPRCPRCSCAHTPVAAAYPLPGGRLRTTRVCRHCEHVFRVTEPPEDKDAPPAAVGWWGWLLSLGGRRGKSGAR